jgi:hypothetical protein
VVVVLHLKLLDLAEVGQVAINVPLQAFLMLLALEVVSIIVVALFRAVVQMGLEWVLGSAAAAAVAAVAQDYLAQVHQKVGLGE